MFLLYSLKTIVRLALIFVLTLGTVSKHNSLPSVPRLVSVPWAPHTAEPCCKTRDELSPAWMSPLGNDKPTFICFGENFNFLNLKNFRVHSTDATCHRDLHSLEGGKGQNQVGQCAKTWAFCTSVNLSILSLLVSFWSCPAHSWINTLWDGWAVVHGLGTRS